MEQYFVGKVATKAIIAKGDEVLLVRDNKDATIWDFPGGKINIGESIESGLKREVMEELGISINVDSLIYSEQVLHKGEGVKYLFITLSATLVDPGASFNLQSEEIGEAKWITKDTFNKIELYENCVKPLKIWWKLD